MPALAAEVNAFKRSRAWDWTQYVRFVNEIVDSGLNVNSAHLTSERVLEVILAKRAEQRRGSVDTATPMAAPGYHREWTG